MFTGLTAAQAPDPSVTDSEGVHRNGTQSWELKTLVGVPSGILTVVSLSSENLYIEYTAYKEFSGVKVPFYVVHPVNQISERNF